MSHVPVDHLVTHEALLGAGPLGLKLRRGYAKLVDIMTGSTGHPFVGMSRQLPALILLMMALAEIIGIDFFDVSITESGGFEINPQGSAGLIFHGPFNFWFFRGFTAAVTGSANLGPESRR